MKGLVCIVAVILLLTGAALYAMEPAGTGQSGPPVKRPAAMPFKPGSEPVTGIEDVRWGEAVSTYTGLAPSGCNVYGFTELCRYRAEGREDSVEEVDVDLLFWRDRLFGVELTTQGRKNWAPFRNMVFKEFGGPPEPATGNEFEWEGERALAHLSYSHRSRRASLLVVSVEVGDEMGRASVTELAKPLCGSGR
jgi:hypothetical protein